MKRQFDFQEKEGKAVKNANKIAHEVARMIGGEVIITEKANGLKKHGVRMRYDGNNNVAPVVYVEDFPDLPLDDLAEKIRQIITENTRESSDLGWISEWEQVKDKVVARLYNQKTTGEVIRSAKEYGFDGLVLIPYVDCTGIMQGGSIKVMRQMVDLWGVTDDELFETAISNIDARITPLGDVLAMLKGGVDLEDLDVNVPIFMVSNAKMCFGASAILKAKDVLRERLTDGFIVIPSSVHEVLVVNKGEMDIMDITDMIESVNESCVKPEEYLGSTPYVF